MIRSGNVGNISSSDFELYKISKESPPQKIYHKLRKTNSVPKCLNLLSLRQEYFSKVEPTFTLSSTHVDNLNKVENRAHINNERVQIRIDIYPNSNNCLSNRIENSSIQNINENNNSIIILSSDFERNILKNIQRCGEISLMPLLRNLLSVTIPTMVRVITEKYLIPSVSKKTTRNIICAKFATATMLPVGLHLLGFIRDLRTGKIDLHNNHKLHARTISMSLIFVTHIFAFFSSKSDESLDSFVNSQLAAVCFYVPLRDFLQYFLRLQDNNVQQLKFNVCFTSAFFYSINQFFISLGTKKLADILTSCLPNKIITILIAFTTLNTIGETIDELTYRKINAIENKNNFLRIFLRSRSLKEIDIKSCGNQLCNTMAGRMTMISSLISIAYCFDSESILKNFLLGLVTILTYVSFFYVH